MKEILHYISNLLGKEIIDVRSLSGGSISSAYLLHTVTKEEYFLKINKQIDALDMFLAEQEGLKEIELTNTVAVPKVYYVEQFKSLAFLLMEYVPNKRASSDNFIMLGKQLALMHQQRAELFGYKSNNFIGSLNQANNQYSTWSDFYWYERIAPQLKLAHQRKWIKSNELISNTTGCSTIKEIIGKDVVPVLLHGDLWGGNYLISDKGIPYLIDPAIYYGHSMVDIAMSKLFGGFREEFYKSYHTIIPKAYNYDDLIEIYQLYFLIVHLNLFGSSYSESVKQILNKFF